MVIIFEAGFGKILTNIPSPAFGGLAITRLEDLKAGTGPFFLEETGSEK